MQVKRTKNRMIKNCGIDAHRLLYRQIDRTINVLWSTVRPALSLSSELEQKSAIGPHVAPIDLRD